MKRSTLIRISTVPGSLDAFLEGQLKMLSEHYEVIAVSSPGKSLDIVKEREKVQTVAIPMERHISLFKDLVSLWRLMRLFIKVKPYAVHSMTPKAGLLAMLAARLTRVPVRIHTFTGLVFPTATGLMQKLLIMTDRLTCSCCTYINPEGQGVKRDLERFGITKKPLHVIANGNVRGINLNLYQRTPEVMAKAAQIKPKDKITFCFIGRLVRDKGINELIQAFVRLYQDYPQIHLLLVGSFEPHLDPLLPETVTHIQQHPGIEYVGPQPDVRPFLAASDIFVFPSYREGFPNVVLEAGALGLPAIVTDINGSNEIIQQGINGEIIPSKDEAKLYEVMKKWLDHPEQVAAMAAHARPNIADRFDQQLVWKALLQTYQELIK